MSLKPLIFASAIILALATGILLVTIAVDYPSTLRVFQRADFRELFKAGGLGFLAITMICAIASSSAILWKAYRASPIASVPIVVLLVLQVVLGVVDFYWFSVLTFIQAALYWLQTNRAKDRATPG
jgi:hypothetical protein